MSQARGGWSGRTGIASRRSVAKPSSAALLKETGLAPERVFLATEGKVAANDELVRFELAVK